MKILSASQPPPPHSPFPLLRPPTHCLAHSRRRKFIKMKLRLQFTGFIKIYLPLTDTACRFVHFTVEDNGDSPNNLVSFISKAPPPPFAYASRALVIKKEKERKKHLLILLHHHHTVGSNPWVVVLINNVENICPDPTI